jgi:archaemetzincin
LEIETKMVVVVPLGAVRDREIEAVRRALARTYDLEVTVAPRRALPRATYYPPRRRYRADHLIAWLGKGGPGWRVLGVTRADVSTTARGRKDWGVAGLAFLGGRSAVVSSFRTKGSLPRLAGVAVHEVGHTLGLPHCPTPGCRMQDANGRLARIGTAFCAPCRSRIAGWLR